MSFTWKLIVLNLIHIILLCGILSCHSSKNEHGSAVSGTKQEKTMKHGLVFINNAPRYIIPNQLGGLPSMTHPLSERKVLIKYGYFSWREKYITVGDMYTTDDNPIEGTQKKYHYKIENEMGYISADKMKWVPLKIEVLDDKEYKKGSFTTLMKLRISSEYFSGIYEMVDEQHGPH